MKTIHTIIAVSAGALFGGLVGVETVVALLLGAGLAYYIWRVTKTKVSKAKN